MKINTAECFCFSVEESFAALIGIIFVYEAFDKMIDINRQRPVQLHTNAILPPNCTCITQNGTANWKSTITINVRARSNHDPSSRFLCLGLHQEPCVSIRWDAMWRFQCENLHPGRFLLLHPSLLFHVHPGVHVEKLQIQPIPAHDRSYCALMRQAARQHVSLQIRSKVSDFGVVLAIFANVTFDYMVGLDTPKLIVPRKFATTKEGRGWVINPFAKNPPHMWFAAILPALLATILIFMDQQITAVIVNRKENKLKVGENDFVPHPRQRERETFLASRKETAITWIC